MSNTTRNIQAILFATAEPQSLTSLAKRLSVSTDEIRTEIDELSHALEGQAYMLVHHADTVALVIRPEQQALIETIRKEELSKDLSKASAEVLAIVAYHPGISKAEIEFIRGVNSAYSIRALLMRGLITAEQSGRSSIYHPTLDLLQSYGIGSINELPQYEEMSKKIEALLQQKQQ